MGWATDAPAPEPEPEPYIRKVVEAEKPSEDTPRRRYQRRDMTAKP